MNEHLENLKEIRSMMERSSKFLSLSGLSGISAGICALAGAFYTYSQLHLEGVYRLYNADIRHETMIFLVKDALLVLISALILGTFFTVRKAHQQNLRVWNTTSKRLLMSLIIPLLTGGFFCLGLLMQGIYWICFPATLVFYGLALLNASKYTV